MKRATQLAYYGTTIIKRAMCPECHWQAFVIKGRMACCDVPFAEPATAIKRISDVPLGRHIPSRKRQAAILAEQDYRCLYCERRFGSYVYRGKRPIRLRLHWDHMVPYVYSLDNRPDNFAVGCHICNGMKSSFVYNTVEEARVDLKTRWEAKGFTEATV